MEHKLQLPNRRRETMERIVKKLSVCELVSYQDSSHSIISIYPESSPLFGYLLLSGIGSPVLAAKIKKEKK